MSQDPFAGQAARLVARSVTPQAQDDPGKDGRDAWADAAENCVLARTDSLRIFGGLPRHQAALPLDQRLRRLENLLRLWASGCTCVVDECLFADILNRRRPR